MPLGVTWRPAPISWSWGTDSKIVTVCPERDVEIAAARPQRPPPMMRRWRGLVVGAGGWIAEGLMVGLVNGWVGGR